MNLHTRYFSAALLALAAACGGGSDDGGTTPTPTAASVTITTATTGSFVSLGETRAASATAKDASGNSISGATFTWTTSNAAVATVSGSGSSATITSVGNGTAVITATSGSATSTVNIDVAQKFSNISLTGTTTLAIGATSALSAVARDARNTAISGATGITFTTSDRTKALVDAAGLVTAIAPGSATITASLTRDGVTASGTANITVTSPAGAATSVNVAATGSNTFTPASVTVGLGGTVNYAFTGDHNVLFSGTGAPSDIPTTNSGTVSRVFNTIGSFAYTCSLHAGMNGTVIVTAPGIFAQMNGANERPTATPSTANGSALFTRNGANVSYTVTYQGIASAPTGLHIHAPANNTAATGIIVDLLTSALPNTSGVLTGTFNATAIRSIAGAPPISMDSLFVLLTTGNAYVNVHSSTYPAGEIRGQTGLP